jgi:hypothetical protein
MVSIDDFLKIILTVSVSFGVFGISLQIMRLLSKVVDILELLKHPIENLSELSDSIVEDYNDIRNYLQMFKSAISGVEKAASSFQFMDIIKFIRNRGKGGDSE